MGISIREVEQAAERIREGVKQTPIVAYNDRSDFGQVQLKCENFQPVGAFKIRGALNAVMQLSADERAQGVVTHSSGNHAQALAYAASQCGITAHIVMPENSPSIKVEGVKAHGGIVYICPATEEARNRRCQEIQAETGAALIHPFNDERIIAGQGTLGLELLNQLSSLKTVVAPIGGGGLISGLAIALKESDPSIRLIGVEPEGANDTSLSLKNGKREPLPGGGKSIAEGLLSTVGPINFEIIQKYVDEVVTVSDREIALATLALFEKNKLVAEPSGATAFAAILSGKLNFSLTGSIAIVSGGNMDIRRFPNLLSLIEEQ